MDSLDRLEDCVFDKPTNTDVDGEGQDYMDEDPRVLILREQGTHYEPVAITKATTELKNQAWEGATHPMEDPLEKTKTTKPFTPIKSIISVPIDFVTANIAILVKSVYDHVSIPIESVIVEFVKNPIPHKIISNSTYLLALSIFISEISKETLNSGELKQGH